MNSVLNHLQKISKSMSKAKAEISICYLWLMKLGSISGITDVDSFDEQAVVVYTDLGLLTIRGSSLHINRLSIETGELSVEGEISSLTYTDAQPKNASFFSKVFR